MDEFEGQSQRLNIPDVPLLDLDVVKRIEIVKGPNVVTLFQKTFADMGPNEAGATRNQEIHRAHAKHKNSDCRAGRRKESSLLWKSRSCHPWRWVCPVNQSL